MARYWTRDEEEMLLKLYKNNINYSVFEFFTGKGINNSKTKIHKFVTDKVIEKRSSDKWPAWPKSHQIDFVKSLESSMSNDEIIGQFLAFYPIFEIEEKIKNYRDTNIKRDFPLYENYRFLYEQKLKGRIKNIRSRAPRNVNSEDDIDAGAGAKRAECLITFKEKVKKLPEEKIGSNRMAREEKVSLKPVSVATHDPNVRQPDLGNLRDIVECMLEAGEVFERDLNKIVIEMDLPAAFVKIFFAELDIKGIWPKSSRQLPLAMTEETLDIALSAAKKNMYMLRTLVHSS
jgi:hypothetical protein